MVAGLFDNDYCHTWHSVLEQESYDGDLRISGAKDTVEVGLALDYGFVHTIQTALHNQ
jgi:hypothetical protein